MSDDVQLHPVVAALIRQVVPADDGARSRLSKDAFAEARRQLRARLEEDVLFVHLALAFVRLRRGGLDDAAAQFLELAKLGLKEDQLSQSLAALKGAEHAAGRLSSGERTAMEGLSPGSGSGVGLRGKPGKTKRKR